MQYSDLEQKLIRLALNNGAHAGESDAAASKLINSLRKRGITAEQMFHSSTAASNPSDGIYQRLYKEENARAKSLYNELVKLRLQAVYDDTHARNLKNECEYLKSELEKARQQAAAATAAAAKVTATQVNRRAAFGINQLSKSEQDFLVYMANRAKAVGAHSRGNITCRLHRVARSREEHGLMTRLVKKGFTIKVENCYHRISEIGAEYLKTYYGIQ